MIESGGIAADDLHSSATGDVGRIALAPPLEESVRIGMAPPDIICQGRD